MKVFSFAASCRGEKSLTARFSDMVAAKLTQRAAETGESVEYECLRGDQLRIDYCRGCESCFRQEACPLDSCDDMAVLKQKMLEADILLFCSPVYTGSMSGIAKSVMDRLASWTHRMELAGKTAAILVTTSSNHGPETVEAIRIPLLCMGASVAYAGFVCRHSGGINIHLPKQMGPETDKICGSLLDCYRDPAKYIDDRQNRLYEDFCVSARKARAFADLIGEEPLPEARFWESRGFLQYKTLTDYIRMSGKGERP